VTSAEMDELVRRANASGFETVADYAVSLEYALRRILDHGKTHEEPCWALHSGDCADVFQEIARVALSEAA
jgi:hypothetical protein